MTPRRLAACGLLAAGAYVAGLLLSLPALRFAAKPIPVLCLALWAVGGGDAYARLVAGGLVASAVGDLLLELPGGFLAGLAAFLLAHLAYTAAFVWRGRERRLLRALPFAAYGALLLAYLRPGLGAMAWPVAAYTAAISVMMWRAAACLGPGVATAAAAPRLALLGALSFAASDSLIALDRFSAQVRGVRYPIILLYWAGQLGIALSARGARLARATVRRP